MLPEIIIAWKNYYKEYAVDQNQSQGHLCSFIAESDKEKVLLKIHDNEATARREQAANFYLSQAHEFIVPTDQDKPFEYRGEYITTQTCVVQENNRSIEYYVKALAKMHETSGLIPKKLLEPLSVPSFERIFESIATNIPKKKIAQHEKSYRRGLDLLLLKKDLLHGDPKVENFFGRYVIDLERITLGHPAWDIAFVLNDPLVGSISSSDCDEAEYISEIYAQGRAVEDIQEFSEQIRDVQIVRAFNSISWNITHAEREGERGERKIEHIKKKFDL